MSRVLVTGGAGFIGSHLVEALLDRGDEVVVLDNFCADYEPGLKRRNLARVAGRVRLVEGDVRDRAVVDSALQGVQKVAHLAARAGVRPSIREPEDYVDNNVRGIQCLLDGMRELGVRELVYASSSSVYGARAEGPFLESDPVARPESPYAATKMAGELLCHAAARTSGLQATCLRLFTVYGPRQRPTMAIHLFARRARAGLPLQQFGDGASRRDYTFVEDIVGGLLSALDRPQRWAVYNLGNGNPVTLAELLAAVASVFEVQPAIEILPDQPGDVPITWAAIERARRDLDYEPRTDLTTGLRRFRVWLDEEAAGL